MKKIYYILISIFFVSKVFAQSTTILPDRVSVPKMTTVVKNALPNKTEGMMVYDATLQQFSYWTGTTWANFGSTALGPNGWQQIGNDINYNKDINSNNASSSYTNSSNYPIPDNSPIGVSSIINIPLMGVIIDPNLVTVSIAMNHTFAGDIIATLISPNGNHFVLLGRVGGGSDINSTNVLSFNNTATMSITPILGGTIPSGLYLPSGTNAANLSNLFAETATGNWTLFLQDNTTADVGTLISWTINFGANSLGTAGKVGIGTSSPQVRLDVKGGMNVSQNVGIGVTTPQAKLDVNGDFKVSANPNWEVKVAQNNMANIELRQVTGGGTPYIDFSDDATEDYDGRVLLSGNSMNYLHAFSSGSHLFSNGTKTLFSINGDGSAEVNGGFKTKYSGSIITTPPGTGNQLFNLTIAALPAGWDLTNTVVLVSIADGGFGQIGQAKLLNSTTIEIRENVQVGGVTRYNYIIFKL